MHAGPRLQAELLVEERSHNQYLQAENFNIKWHLHWLTVQSGYNGSVTLPDCGAMASDFHQYELRHGSALCQFFQHWMSQSMARHRETATSSTWCLPPLVEVTRVVMVKNPVKQLAYETARKTVLQRNPDGCTPKHALKAPTCFDNDGDSVCLNEYLLFHGCPFSACDQIAKQGLDPQRGGEGVGHMFGIGTYFAQNASKSDLYTTCSDCEDGARYCDCRHAQGERCILAARVLLGESKDVYESCSGRTRAPERDDTGEPYDSLTAMTRQDGGVVDHMEFVIFKEQMALVQYMIYYRHLPACNCHNCRHRRSL